MTRPALVTPVPPVTLPNHYAKCSPSSDFSTASVPRRTPLSVGSTGMSTATHACSADSTPVCPKSSPFQSSGSRRSSANAYERQSPKFKPAE